LGTLHRPDQVAVPHETRLGRRSHGVVGFTAKKQKRIRRRGKRKRVKLNMCKA